MARLHKKEVWLSDIVVKGTINRITVRPTKKQAKDTGTQNTTAGQATLRNEVAPKSFTSLLVYASASFEASALLLPILGPQVCPSKAVETRV